MKKQAYVLPLFIIICAGVLAIGALIYTLWQVFPVSVLSPVQPSVEPPVEPIIESEVEFSEIKKFASKEEFKAYLEEASGATYPGFGGIGAIGMRATPGLMAERMPPAPEAPMEEFKGELGYGAAEPPTIPERVSETTVQVAGIDEPDIVKTDGQEIYFSPQISFARPIPIMEERIIGKEGVIPPSQKIGQTKLIKAFPPQELALDSSIDKAGNLLLKNNVLVIFSGQEILGYNVADPRKPEKKWEVKLEERTSLVSARLYEDKIYLVTRENINYQEPCPIRPLSTQSGPIEIDCGQIYHPRKPIPIDVTHSALVLDSQNGQVVKKTSFVGSSGDSVVYMSPQALYATYPYYTSITKFMLRFFQEECKDFIPDWIIEKLKKLETYDISEQSKMEEIETALKKYLNSLTSDERMRIENEMTNRMQDYSQKHQRELEKTGIMKISLDNFEVLASGNIPGTLLNQFSLDEYLDHLRVATTTGQGFFSFGESVNDVYVLDKDLNIVGQVLDMGKTEHIYSVRFIQDKGYVVTFKQIDPFYVIDLADPQSPAVKGELKIPGYSSYLHPITKDDILGIGKEGSQVKISLFNVSDPANPSEKDKYLLNEYWSDILNTHHAFLLDEKHQIFFLPGSKGAYVFSYQDDKLTLEKILSGRSVRRAIYINDYLYIIGDSQIWILDENTWEEVKELELR